MSERQQHWDIVYRDKNHQRVSWFQADCTAEAAEINALDLPRDSLILDVGAGASRLVDALLEEGYSQLHALDIAAGGLAIAQQRLGEAAARVHWHCADITRAELPRPIALWHDRAALHFLTDADDQQAYVRQLRQHLAPGGYVMLAAFAINGPEKCSDLVVEKYDAAKMLVTLGEGFELMRSEQRVHVTPAGAEQLFAHFLFKWKG